LADVSNLWVKLVQLNSVSHYGQLLAWNPLDLQQVASHPFRNGDQLVNPAHGQTTHTRNEAPAHASKVNQIEKTVLTVNGRNNPWETAPARRRASVPIGSRQMRMNNVEPTTADKPIQLEPRARLNEPFHPESNPGNI
jgi:hypothetical protein